MPCKSVISLVVSLALWVFGILSGFAVLQHYTQPAGPGNKAAVSVVEVLASHRVPGRPLLVMAIHPLCSCTDASFAEMSELLACSHGACDALLLQVQPMNGAPDWPAEWIPPGGQSASRNLPAAR